MVVSNSGSLIGFLEALSHPLEFTKRKDWMELGEALEGGGEGLRSP